MAASTPKLIPSQLSAFLQIVSFKLALRDFRSSQAHLSNRGLLTLFVRSSLNRKGKLYSEVERLVQRRGRYTLISTGYDLTSEQRNKAKDQIESVLAGIGIVGYGNLIDVLGARQLSEFVERYPGVASSIITDPIQEALLLEEWRQDAHMSNTLEMSKEQTEIINHIRAGLLGDQKPRRTGGSGRLE